MPGLRVGFVPRKPAWAPSPGKTVLCRQHFSFIDRELQKKIKKVAELNIEAEIDRVKSLFRLTLY